MQRHPPRDGGRRPVLLLWGEHRAKAMWWMGERKPVGGTLSEPTGGVPVQSDPLGLCLKLGGEWGGVNLPRDRRRRGATWGTKRRTGGGWMIPSVHERPTLIYHGRRA